MPRIFLSYARGDDENFVKHLHADLTAAGFTVWFDRESLMSRGLNFHQEIKDAIRTEVDRVVYVGGPKAALSAYVREEWQFALEFDHVVVTPVLRLGDYETCVPGELGLLHCEDFRDDTNYSAALAKLIENLRQPNPKLGALFAVPSLPPHFLGRPELMRRVRDALLVDLQKPQVITSADAKVGMQGMGGIGKSVLAAALARNREVRESYPDGIIWISCGQKLTRDDLLARLRDVAKDLAGDTAFDSIPQGQGVLRELLQAKAVLLVLDDVWQSSDAQTFDVIGPRCRMLVTTRDAGILHALHGELVPVSLFTEPEALQLLADAVGCERSALPPEALEVVRECGCLPLAVALSGGMAKAGHSWKDIVEALREADLEWAENREGANEQHRSIWNAMTASYAVLSADEKARFAELAVFPTEGTAPEAAAHVLWQHTARLGARQCTKLLINLSERSLVQLDTRTADDGQAVRRFRLHDLLHDYATRVSGELAALHRTLIAAYRAKCPDGWHTGPNDGYFLQNLAAHLIAGEQTDELVRLHLDLRWLEAKNGAGLTYTLPLDFVEAITALASEHPRRRILELLHEAIRRDIHFIARHAKDYPQGLFQCLWNSGWWHDCEGAIHQYTQGQAPRDLVRTGQHAGEVVHSLSNLLEHWRVERQRAYPGFQWLRDLRPPVVRLGGRMQAILRGHEGEPMCVSWAPDGKRVASGAGTVTQDVGHLFKTVFKDNPSASLQPCDGLWAGIFREGAYENMESFDRSIRIWDIESGTVLAILRGHTGGVMCVKWSPDGRWIASGSWDSTVRLWDPEGRTDPVILDQPGGRVSSLSWSPDGKRLAIPGGKAATVRLWDVESGTYLPPLCEHALDVSKVSWSPDGQRIASASTDGTISVWDVEGRSAVVIFRKHGSSVSSMDWSYDGTRLAFTVGYESCIHIWDASTGMVLPDLRLSLEKRDPQILICWLPKKERIVVSEGSDAGNVLICDATNGEVMSILHGHEYRVACVDCSPDGRQIASGSYDQTVRVWSADGENDTSVAHGHKSPIEDMMWSPDGQRLATCSSDSICVWDAESGYQLAELLGHGKWIRRVGWSRSGRQIIGYIGNAANDSVVVWDGESSNSFAVSRTPDGIITTNTNTIASRYRMAMIEVETVLEDVASGKPIAWFPEKLAVVRAHPHNPLWAARRDIANHVYILKLERQDAGMPFSLGDYSSQEQLPPASAPQA